MLTNASAAASVPGHVPQESGCSWKTNHWNNWGKRKTGDFFEATKICSDRNSFLSVVI
jgi:hypothetical protein